jgi:hypothetical protein
MILRQLLHALEAAPLIGEERHHNPLLQQVRPRAEYVAQMAQLRLPKPALMEEVLPANLGASLLSIEGQH